MFLSTAILIAPVMTNKGDKPKTINVKRHE